MKNPIYFIALASLLIVGCSRNSEKKESQIKDQKAIEETEIIDSISSQIEDIKIEIETSSKEVDSLLNEL